MKIFYHLPGLFEFYDLYKAFLPLFREHRDYFYDWCEIGSIYGAPKDCIWGGGRVGFGEETPSKVAALLKEFGISARLTFSNSLLREEHLSDGLCNSLCRQFERGDLENNFDREITKGVFYGMVNTDMLNNANFGANLTEPPTDVTADYASAKWYAIAEDSAVDSDPGSEGGSDSGDDSDDDGTKDDGTGDGTGSKDDEHTTIVQTFAPLTTAETQYNVFSVNGKFLGQVKAKNATEARDMLKTFAAPRGVYLIQDSQSHKTLKIRL